LVGGGVCGWIFAGVARVFAEQFPADPVKKFSDARKWLVSAFIGT
jgi:hypothetical protein